jgi:hypothetical protein
MLLSNLSSKYGYNLTKEKKLRLHKISFKYNKFEEKFSIKHLIEIKDWVHINSLNCYGIACIEILSKGWTLWNVFYVSVPFYWNFCVFHVLYLQTFCIFLNSEELAQSISIFYLFLFFLFLFLLCVLESRFWRETFFSFKPEEN